MHVWLQAINPFTSVLPSSAVGEDLSSSRGQTAALIGFALAQHCLYGATLWRKNIVSGEGEAKVLENHIDVSLHYLIDFAEASNGITPALHFKTYSILFESLVYEANPGVSYDRVFGIPQSD